MGSGLVKAAYELGNAKSIPHAPMRLLVFMAVTARDDDENPTFYGGMDKLTYAMNVTDPSTVRTALRALKSVGAIAVQQLGHRGGRHTQYRLLDGQGNALHTPQEKAGSDTPPSQKKAGTDTTKGGDSRPVKAGSHSPPQEKEEKEEETRASAPTRTCTRHSHWNHSERCGACGADRLAVEAFEASRRPLTMSEQRPPCPPGKHRMLPNGSCMLCPTVAEPIQKGAA